MEQEDTFLTEEFEHDPGFVGIKDVPTDPRITTTTPCHHRSAGVHIHKVSRPESVTSSATSRVVPQRTPRPPSRSSLQLLVPSVPPVPACPWYSPSSPTPSCLGWPPCPLPTPAEYWSTRTCSAPPPPACISTCQNIETRGKDSTSIIVIL